MLDFKLFEDNDKQNKVLFMLTLEDIYFLQGDIFDYLNDELGSQFTIVVDMFLRNGFTFNRFVALTYDGNDNVKTTIVNSREVSEEIKCYINLYLKQHEDLLQNSSLTKNTVDFVLSGKTSIIYRSY